MVVTIKGKLLLTDDEKKILIQTLATINSASNWLSQKVRSMRRVNTVKVHHATYYELRERLGLPAAHACAVIRRVCNAYKRRSKKERFKKIISFKQFSAIDLNKGLIAFRGIDKVAMTTVSNGRQVFPIQFGEYYAKRLAFKRDSAQLIYRKDIDEFFITVAAEVPEDEPITPQGYLGVDLGIKNIAVDSLGNFYGGEEVIKKREHYKGKRKELQRKKHLNRKFGKDTHSVRKVLKRVSKKEKRFVNCVCHVVSKSVISTAKALSLSIALENLKGVKGRITASAVKDERYQKSSWAYYRLRQFITYKAKLVGVPVNFVNPHNTSLTCSKCGYVDKKNRVSQAEFRCKRCGYMGHADLVAARNIALRAWATNPLPIMPEGFNPLLG